MPVNLNPDFEFATLFTFLVLYQLTDYLNYHATTIYKLRRVFSIIPTRFGYFRIELTGVHP